MNKQKSEYKNFNPVKILISLTILLALIGCGDKNKEISNKPSDKKILNMSIESDPTTLDPAFIKDVTGGKIAAMIFNNLVRFDLNGNLIGDISDTWSISSDNKTYSFKLRDDVYFINGEMLT